MQLLPPLSAPSVDGTMARGRVVLPPPCYCCEIVNTAIGLVGIREEEEDAEVEDELIAAVLAQAQLHKVAPATEGQAEDTQGTRMMILYSAVQIAPEMYLLCCRGAVDESVGPAKALVLLRVACVGMGRAATPLL